MMRLFLLLLMLGTTALAQTVVTNPQSIVINPIPAYAIEVFVDKDTSGNASPSYAIGEAISIGVRVAEASYVYVFNVRNTGEVRQLIPNRYDADGKNNYLQAGETRYFPPNNARYTFNVDGPEGLDKVIAVASKTPLDTRQLADFGSDPNFATSNIGQAGFAQTFSIVITPIPQNEWVTDTAVFYVGSLYVEPQPVPVPLPSTVLFNNPYLLAYPGSSVTYVENGSRQQEAEFDINVDSREVYRHFHDQLTQAGWQRIGLELKGNKVQASYQLNGEQLEFELKQLGASGKYRLELLSL
jgi:Domain of unknown function (DUF4384)